jgi:uroporphyrinogen-III decarboxylase
MQGGKRNAGGGNLWPVIEDFLFGCGNLDCVTVLPFGTPDEVKTHTKDCLAKGWGSGGHILCANNAITESVPFQNYTAVYEAYREFFNMG